MSPSPSWKTEGDCLWVPRRVTFFPCFSYSWKNNSTNEDYFQHTPTDSDPGVGTKLPANHAICRLAAAFSRNVVWKSPRSRRTCRTRRATATVSGEKTVRNVCWRPWRTWRWKRVGLLIKAMLGTCNTTDKPPDTSGAAFAVSDLVIYQVLQVLSLSLHFPLNLYPQHSWTEGRNKGSLSLQSSITLRLTGATSSWKR